MYQQLFSVPLSEEQGKVNPQPVAGLNYVLYNADFDIVEANTGTKIVEDKINVIQTLNTDKFVIQQNGFFEVFVNNDAQTPVFFDNLVVSHTPSQILEVNTYYPFGMLMQGSDMTFQSAIRDEWNGYKYNAKELETALNLGWGFHDNRMADYTLGRWWVPDPLAEKGYSISPYAYAFNNPINFVDPDGKWPWEARNVRQARRYARQTGGEFNKWKGQNGKTWASVITRGGEATITSKVFQARYYSDEQNAVSEFVNNLEIGMRGNSYEANASWEGKKGFYEKGLPTLGIMATLFSGGTSALLKGSLTLGNIFWSSLSIANNVNNFGEGNNMVNTSPEFNKATSVGVDLAGITSDALSAATGNPGAIPSLIINSTQLFQDASGSVKIDGRYAPPKPMIDEEKTQQHGF